MSNNKQSSIEWLFEQIARRQGSIFQTIPFYDDNYDLIQQAKEMHKKEIINGYANGHNDGCRYMDNLKQNFEHGENYYHETFKNK